jgi:hypothetical protein
MTNAEAKILAVKTYGEGSYVGYDSGNPDGETYYVTDPKGEVAGRGVTWEDAFDLADTVVKERKAVQAAQIDQAQLTLDNLKASQGVK